MHRCHTCGFCLSCGDVDPGEKCPVCGGGSAPPYGEVEPIRSR